MSRITFQLSHSPRSAFATCRLAHQPFVTASQSGFAAVQAHLSEPLADIGSGSQWYVAAFSLRSNNAPEISRKLSEGTRKGEEEVTVTSVRIGDTLLYKYHAVLMGEYLVFN